MTWSKVLVKGPGQKSDSPGEGRQLHAAARAIVHMHARTREGGNTE